MRKEQWDLLLPANQSTSTDSLDVTLVVFLIHNVLKFPNVSEKSDYDALDPLDSSIVANATRSRQIYNFLHHNEPTAVDDDVFERLWMEGERVLKELRYPINLDVLSDAPLDTIITKHSAELLRIDKEMFCT